MQEIKKLEDRTEYYEDGKLHRDNDLPAVEWNNGAKHWYQYGKRHRLGGPAIEFNNSKEWYQNGKKHRLDGPAYENIYGSKFWYIENKAYSEEEFNKIISGKYEVRKLYNRTEYYKDGKLHRDNDLPAVELNNGHKEWYKNGLLHRLNGPAIEYANGSKYWYIEGEKYIEIPEPIKINGVLLIKK